MTLPDIPRLYTALAEVLAVLVYAQAAPPRAAKPVTYAVTAGWAAVLGVFLQLTGGVPLAWWLPCMVAAIAWLYLYLWAVFLLNSCLDLFSAPSRHRVGTLYPEVT